LESRCSGPQDDGFAARNTLHRRRCASAILALPSAVLGPVDSPPWNRQRRFPGITRMMHWSPARVSAQHLGRNLRFKGSPLCDSPRSSICRHQCISRQVTSRHARPVLGQRTTVVIEQIPCLCAGISVRNVRPHDGTCAWCRRSSLDIAIKADPGPLEFSTPPGVCIINTGSSHF